jgi:hypothetical protein
VPVDVPGGGTSSFGQVAPRLILYLITLLLYIKVYRVAPPALKVGGRQR